MMGLGAPEIILIVFILVLMFGGKKIPELMRGLGRGVREFNEGKSNVRNELEESTRDRERPAKTPTTPSSTTPTQP